MVETSPGRRLVAAGLASSLMPLNSTMIAVALPQIGDDFGHDPATVTQALVTSYLVAAVVLQSPGGKLGDRIGHGRMLAIGQVLVGAGALLGYLAPSLEVLTVARLLMAAGGAVFIPSTGALIRHHVPVERRGRAFGIFGAVLALAAALGPLVGGELVRAFGWPSVFAANLPVLALSAALAATAGSVAARPVSAPARFDWVGSCLLGVAMTCVVFGLDPDGGHAVLLLLLGAGLFVPFALWEGRVRDPVVAFSLFRSKPFTAGALVVALQNLVTYALLFEISLLAVRLFDLEARATGRLLLSLMLAMVVMHPVAGRLVDRFGARPIALAGSAAALGAVATLGLIELTSSGEVVLPLALLGVGLGLATPAAMSAAMSGAPAESAGMAAGVSSTMRYLGGIAGVALMSLLLDVGGTRAEVISDHRTLMVVFAGVLLLSLAVSALLPGRARSVGVTGFEPVTSSV